MAEESSSTLPFGQRSSADDNGSDFQIHDASAQFASTMDDIPNQSEEWASGTASSNAPQSNQAHKHATPTPTTTTTTDDPYARLASGFDQIFSQSSDFDVKSYMSFYTEVHRMVTSQKAAKSSALRRKGRGAHLLGEELYFFVRDYIQSHLRSVHDDIIKQSGDQLIPFYLNEWRRFVAAAKRNKHVLGFLERHWIKREMDEGKKDVYEIYDLHLVIWKNEVLQAVNERSESVLVMLRKRIEESEGGRDESEADDLEEVRESFVVVGHPGEEGELKEVRESFAAVGIKESKDSDMDSEAPMSE